MNCFPICKQISCKHCSKCNTNSADEPAAQVNRLFYTFISKQHKSVWHFSKQTTTMEKKMT